MPLTLHNSLSGQKEVFIPIDDKNIRMYVCGPTVYDRPHIGNARAVVVYDVLFRVLNYLYPDNSPKNYSDNKEEDSLDLKQLENDIANCSLQDNVKQSDRVTFVRNITDVDDKINARAHERNITIGELTQEITEQFHADMAALNNLPPTIEPRATEHIEDIILLCEKLLANGHAYESDGHVLFSVKTDPFYGQLSGKKIEDLIAGARVDVESYKHDSGDFVLWKPSTNDTPGWSSPWGRGRPGWHIECTAMITRHLGSSFDIHGGGADLKFPHHENEISQGVCANPGSSYAKYWVHNGFVTVGGEKMSKSLGNFTTVKDLLDKGVKGEAIRYVLLNTHYRKPLDFTDKALDDATKNLNTLYKALQFATKQNGIKDPIDPTVQKSMIERSQAAYESFHAALLDDLNTPKALSELYVIAKGVRSLDTSPRIIEQFKECAALVGLVESDAEDWFSSDVSDLDVEKIESLITKRTQAKSTKNWTEADAIRDELTALGVTIKDTPDGVTWEKSTS